MHATTVNNWPKWDISALRESVQQYLGNINGVTSSQSKDLCRKSATLYRFLHMGTKSTNAYHRKHPATAWGSHSYATIIEHSSINICLSAACNLHVTSENYHHFKIYSLLPMVLSGVKKTGYKLRSDVSS